MAPIGINDPGRYRKYRLILVFLHPSADFRTDFIIETTGIGNTLSRQIRDDKLVGYQTE